MPRVPRFPPYPKKAHTGSGQARVRLPGHQKLTYLGVFGSKESWAKYHHLLSEWTAGRLKKDQPAAPVTPPACASTIADMLAAWWTWAQQTQRNEGGELRKEVVNMGYSFKPLRRLHGDKTPAEFDASTFRKHQGELASGAWLTAAERAQRQREGRPIGWCRNLVNRATSRIKLLFDWAECEKFAPEGHAARLAKVRGISENEHGVRVTDEVPPVPEEVMAATLPHLQPIPRDVIELLLLTGARPDEILKLRPCDINRSGTVELARGFKVELGAGVWAYQPRRHKTRHKGHKRVVLFGPRAQAILTRYLDRPLDAFLFSPAESIALWRAAQRQARRTPVQPSQMDRSRPGARRPGARYPTHALSVAVERAAERAGVAHWSPYMLRHLAATRMVEEFGMEATMALLGHKHAKTLAVYALPALKAASEAAKEAG